MDDVKRSAMTKALKAALPAALDGRLSPMMGATGVVVPHDWRDAGAGKPGAALSMRMAFDQESQRNGEKLVERVREYVKRLRRGRDEDRGVRELRRLVSNVPALAISVPEHRMEARRPCGQAAHHR